MKQINKEKRQNVDLMRRQTLKRRDEAKQQWQRIANIDPNKFQSEAAVSRPLNIDYEDSSESEDRDYVFNENQIYQNESIDSMVLLNNIRDKNNISNQDARAASEI